MYKNTHLRLNDGSLERPIVHLHRKLDFNLLNMALPAAHMIFY